MNAAKYGPGSLVAARGREWIVLPGSDGELLRLRPISGSEEEPTLLHVGLEPDGVTDAVFPPPDAGQRASHEAALLLRDALLLSLRRGAGPFRSFGQLAVQPRAYQLVPLLMALKLDPVRLLIADDVGVGKTIEAALIARELLDRGDIDRLVVLCPPHLVEQWVGELEARFQLRAVAVTAASAGRLERALPPGESVFAAHPYTVVSLDYIKSERRRDEFLRACPNFVIVDEAHTCAATGPGKHQRYELLRDLSQSPARHLVLLTATPHSGDEEAYYRLLGLLDARFLTLPTLDEDSRGKLRDALGRHFVQRRRPDIDEWKEGQLFPRRETTELTWRLTGAWQAFFDAVLDYCAGVVRAKGQDAHAERLGIFATLALLRCVSSSPAAALQALRTRAGLTEESEEEALAEQVFDGGADALIEDDVAPSLATDEPALAKLLAQAEALFGQRGDPKLRALQKHLEELLKAGHAPVVFCRYIATAHYLAEHLRPAFPGVQLDVVTGELTSDERRERVDRLGDAPRRLLIATDCLSEGINLQDHLDAVVHYDLSWNPTRHEQREGRVDRYGQPRPVVRATLLYGENNPVDGAVLEVILRKAETIRRDLGVPVPLPDDGHTLTQALLKAVMLRKGSRQEVLSFGESPEAAAIDTVWKDAAEKARRNRTIFAQRRLRPDDVLPEWNKTLAAVGGQHEVQRFTSGALKRLGAALEKLRAGSKAPLDSLPVDVKERLVAEGLEGDLRLDFRYPPADGCRAVQRSHPLVSTLAETLLHRTLEGAPPDVKDPSILGRIGSWTTKAVPERAELLFVRLRHQLTSTVGRTTTTLLVEEATGVLFRGRSVEVWEEGPDALARLDAPPDRELPELVRERLAREVLASLEGRKEALAAFARRRADALLADHRRVREASQARGSWSVTALLPVDPIGLYVLLPPVDGT